MSKDKLLKELETFYENGEVGSYARGKNWGIDIACNVVNKLEEPEKVVIPQMIGDYIKVERDKNTLGNIAECIYVSDDCWSNLSDEFKWIRLNFTLFARAWLDGYTIEQEKRYRLQSTNRLLENNYLCIISTGGRYGCELEEWIVNNELKYVFTESELVEIDELGFKRVEVTE